MIKVGDKIKFKGVGFFGDEIFNAKIVEINNLETNNNKKKYKAIMDIGGVVYLREKDICSEESK